ncbi:HtaA domain-containing protein [Homoserinibacter sp. YIM 151385]|uniref:HtaA domain-containing protein n=1 Tax=Homoserinibacter sp. YIM 151385 TaxID=2985506 RepID=UPI0022F081A6|nr:HtaA domain-containing protein [Homoserinibacter sp. YIM 151385]WBU37061.1 HtaA domain-containing protein [Homoserinibacter sp. YIM 151385]
MPTALRTPLAALLAAVLAIGAALGAGLAPAAAADGPTVSVSPSTGIDRDVATVLTITGAGFTGPGAANGAYVNIGTADTWQPGSVPASSGWIASGWVRPAQIVDGAFTTTLTLPAGAAADAAQTYGVATFAAHGLSVTDRTLDTWSALAFTAAAPDPDPEPEPEPEPAPAVDAAVSVSPSTGIDRTAATVLTISGTGFTGPGAANGAYVNLGTKTAWQPGQVPGQAGWIASGWVRPAQIVDGAFTTTLTLPAGAAVDPDETYGVATFAAHALSATDRSLDTFTPLSFKAAPAPKITVSPSTGIDREAATVLTISGTGFTGAGAANGAYVNLGAASFWEPGTVPAGSGWIASGWVRPAQIVDGAFTTTLTLPAGAAADVDETYGVATFAAHQLAFTDRSLDTFTPIAFRAPAPKPSVTVTPSAGIDREAATVLTITGEHFTGPGAANGAYVNIGTDAWQPGQVPGQAGWIASGWVRPAQIIDGAFTTTLTLPAGAAADLDETYGVATFAAHGLSVTDRTLDTFTPIAFAAPAVAPKVTVSPARDLDPAVATVITITGSGFTGPGAANGAYVNLGTKAAWQPGQTPGQAGWIASGWVRPAQIVDGTFTTTLTLPAGAAVDAAQEYGVATFAAHGLSITDRSLDTWTPLGIREPEVAPTATTASQTLSASRVEAGAELRIRSAVQPAEAVGELRLLVDGEVVETSESGAIDYRTSKLAIGAHTVQTVFVSGDAAWAGSTTARSTVTIVQKAGPESGTKVAGELRWGVKSSFRSYVTGGIAKGAITVSGGAASASDGRFVFPQSQAELADDARTGSAAFRGAVRFTGHEGALDLTIASPAVRVVSATRGELTATVAGSRIVLADLALGGGTRSTSGGALRYTGVPATLTAAGVSAFQGFYPAGERLDPVSFTIGRNSAGVVGGGSTGLVASAAADTSSAIPTTPPATTGLDVEWGEGELVAGDEVTIGATGFRPGETGIKVVIYSDPVLLADDVTADASGAASWTGRLPAGLEGTHTLTIQGSVARGAVLEIGTRTAEGCAVGSAELVWGVKASFRSYISGSIAKGEWTTSGDVAYATPEFTWTGASGDLDAAAGSGLVAFDGAIRFTGHGGVLDTTVANPALELAGDTAYLLLDVTGETQGGEAVAVKAVRFAELDLSEAVVADGVYTVEDAPAALTTQGAEAFGTYEPGEELDPVDLSIQVDADCAAADTPDEPEAPAAAPADDAAAELAPAADQGGIDGWLIAAIALAALIAAVVLVLAIRARGRRA